MTKRDKRSCTWRFSLTAVFTCMFVVSLMLGWWVDRNRLQREVDRLTEVAMFGKRHLYKDLRQPGVIGKAVSEFPEIERFADKWGVSDNPNVWPKFKHQPGKDRICYYFETSKTVAEGHLVAFYVIAIDGKIVHLEEEIPEW